MWFLFNDFFLNFEIHFFRLPPKPFFGFLVRQKVSVDDVVGDETSEYDVVGDETSEYDVVGDETSEYDVVGDGALD